MLSATFSGYAEVHMNYKEIVWHKKNADSASGSYSDCQIEIISAYDQFKLRFKVRVSVYSQRGHNLMQQEFKDKFDISDAISDQNSRINEIIDEVLDKNMSRTN